MCIVCVRQLLQSKLADRVPIAQAISRRQFLEYKLKLASRMEGSASSTGMYVCMATACRVALTAACVCLSVCLSVVLFFVLGLE